MKDNIFTKPITKQFEFDDNVASVFDDMISRSIPFYEEASKLSCELLSLYLKENAKVLDLGCSTSQFLLYLFEIRKDLNMIGIDNSQAMLNIAKNKAKAFGANIDFIKEDILKFDFNSYDCVILNYTLQFIRPPKRAQFVKKIYDGLSKDGIFVFSEKLIYDNNKITKDMIKIYENYKIKQGYSQYEISQKREALENILIPYTEKENKDLILLNGFKSIDTIFKWGNFATFVAIK